MAAVSRWTSGEPPAGRRLDSHVSRAESGPRVAYRAALARYSRTKLAEIRRAQGLEPGAVQIRPAASADEMTEHLDQPVVLRALIARLSAGSRMALGLFPLSESSSICGAALYHALGLLGVQPIDAIVESLNLGLLVIAFQSELRAIDDFRAAIDRSLESLELVLIHPAISSVIRTTTPAGKLPGIVSAASQVRESDGLEPILRLGALWQRIGIEPLRQTQQGVLYKRDRERIEEDPVLAAPFSDAPEPVSDPANFLLAMARRIGLVEPDDAGERLLAAPTQFWDDNSVHLPQMIASGWMALETWHESTGEVLDNVRLAVARYLRIAALLWLATLDDSEWVAIDDLAHHFAALWPIWDRPVLTSMQAESQAPRRKSSQGERTRGSAVTVRKPKTPDLLTLILRGTAHSLGLVREAQQRGSTRRIVQLTPLGRYVLALGPSPQPRATFEHFLFVQPNFELIAYRQGLTNQLIGRLSRFAWWEQIGAALELKLTRESILLGLEKGETAPSMLETLGRHSQRPVPPNVEDAVTNWAGRRDLVTYYAAASLIEFGSKHERDLALASWPAGKLPEAIVVSDRFLLIEDEESIPFDQLRQTSSRDYRRPPGTCATIGPDGVTLAVDPARSDLLVDAELSRFADELPSEPGALDNPHGPAPKRFVVTTKSLRRGASRGMTAAQLAEWYLRRTGAGIPPAVQLLLAVRSSQVPPLQPTRILVLTLTRAELLDGLLQHPAIRPWLGDRLGAYSVTIADECVVPLARALKELGIILEIPPLSS
jgi:hypothetical protein